MALSTSHHYSPGCTGCGIEEAPGVAFNSLRENIEFHRGRNSRLRCISCCFDDATARCSGKRGGNDADPCRPSPSMMTRQNAVENERVPTIQPYTSAFNYATAKRCGKQRDRSLPRLHATFILFKDAAYSIGMLKLSFTKLSASTILFMREAD